MTEERRTNFPDDIHFCGWLEKKKRNATPIGGDTNRRWFVVEPFEDERRKYDRFHKKTVDNGPIGTLTLSYYKSPKSAQKSGWFYLSDVISIKTDPVGRWIEIKHRLRTFHLQAPDHVQHQKWCALLLSLVALNDKRQKEGAVEGDDRKDKESMDGADGKDNLIDADTKTDLGTEIQDATKTDKENINAEANEENRALRELNFLRSLSGKPPLKSPQNESLGSADKETNKNTLTRSAEARDKYRREIVDLSERGPSPNPKIVNKTKLLGKQEMLGSKDADNYEDGKGRRSNTLLPNQASDHSIENLRPSDTESNHQPDIRTGVQMNVDNSGAFLRKVQSSGERNMSTLDVVEDITEFDVESMENELLGGEDPTQSPQKEAWTKESLLNFEQDIVICLEDSDSSYEENFSSKEFGPISKKDMSSSPKNPGTIAKKLKSPASNISIKTHFDPRDFSYELDPEAAAAETFETSTTTINGHFFRVEPPKKRSIVSDGTKEKGREQLNLPFGLTPDKNFATEDWDDSDTDDESKDKQEKEVYKQVSKQPSRRKPSSFLCSVEPDENFVEENWDD